MKFSVIIPVYNKRDTLGAAIQSIYAQTFRDYEILVVDDGSRDAPEEVVAAMPSEKLRLIRQDNGGVSVARNTGLSQAKGEYVCFLDADDLWEPDHLETLHQLTEKYPESRTFLTSHRIITPQGTVAHSSDALKNYDPDFETEDFLGLLNQTAYSVVHTNSICANRAMMEQENIRFEPGIRIGEDTDVWFRLGLKYKVAISKKETTVYQMDLSTATKDGSYVPDWMFSRREQDILSNPQISDQVKASMIHLLDRYKMTGSRECMAAGNRKEARRLLSSVRTKKGKRYLLTKAFTFLPYGFCRRLLGK